MLVETKSPSTGEAGASGGKAKLIIATVVVFTIGFFVGAGLLCKSLGFYPASVKAAGFTLTAKEKEHTIMLPFEKSFLFTAVIKNTSGTKQKFNTSIPEGRGPKDPSKDTFTVLSPESFFELNPGEEINYVITFEANPSSDRAKGQSLNTKLVVSSGGSEQSVDIVVKSDVIDEQTLQSEICNPTFKILDKKTKKEISNASVFAMLPSGVETKIGMAGNNGISLPIVCGDYMKEINSKYNIDHASKGYLLQVSAAGYKSYFKSNFFATDKEKKEISLEKMDQVGEFKKIKEIDTGFPTWWIRGSADSKYFAFSQGTHGSPGIPAPTSSKVTFTDNEGKEIWAKTVGGECWGLDISSKGDYVAAGCHDGKIYLWNKAGDEVWKKENRKETIVRWVKFSPDDKNLLAGPINSIVEESGLFEVSSGKLLWSKYTGGYLREGRFSDDGKIVYLASGNGTLYAVNASDGSQAWLGSGNFYIPFLLGTSNSAGAIIASGKGRAFTALDLITGKEKWKTVVDQTVTAGEVALDGTVVGSTVGGIAYGIGSDGAIKWARNYGGVGHNAVYYTRGGKYAILGGPNPTLFDNEGNILWQREKDAKIKMSGPTDINTGGAYDTWMSEDGSLIILGGDDGKIGFYKGKVKKGDNPYSQITGTMSGSAPMGGQNAPVGEFGKNPPAPVGNRIPLPFLVGVGAAIIAIAAIIIVIVKKRRKSKQGE